MINISEVSVLRAKHLSSGHFREGTSELPAVEAHQPRTPETRSGNSHRLTRLLLNVTIERSLGPVHVVMTVRDLIKAAVEIYVREKRRPLVKETDPHRLELHYSQFSLESLKADEKLIKLGSRNFFLCSKSSNPAAPLSSSVVFNPSNCSEAAKN